MRCDSTDDDEGQGQGQREGQGQVAVNAAQQLVDYVPDADQHPLSPAPTSSFQPHSLDVASNGYLISISDDHT